jgi:hypothetical protein
VKQAIGRADRIPADVARRITAEKLAKLAAGHDVSQERRSARDKEQRRLAQPTMAELGATFLERHSKLHKRSWPTCCGNGFYRTWEPGSGRRRSPIATP